jgi:hypothetical protein
MARRASSGVNLKAVLIGIGIFVLLLGGGYFVLNRKDSFDAPELNFVEFERNSRSLSGNRYKVTGTLVERHIVPEGQMVILHLGDQSSPKPLPIIVPPDFKGGNLNLQADYSFLIEFDTQGVPVAIDVKQL